MKTSKEKAEIREFIEANSDLTYEQMSQKLLRETGQRLNAEQLRYYKRITKAQASKKTKKELPVEQQLELDKFSIKSKEESNNLKNKNKHLIKENEELQKLLTVLNAPRKYNNKKIQVLPKNGLSEATAVVLCSDWHMEQKVDGRRIAYDNNYNLDIAKKRADEFFQAVVKLINKEQQHQKIDNLVLALLGDFITGNIHMSSLPMLQLGVMDACILVEETMIKGIQYILDNTNVKITCPAVVGNHSRITEKVWLSSEQDNSVETIIYYHIKNHFRDEKRFELIMPLGPEIFLDIYGLTYVFAHGHIGYKYGGGVGGLYVPLRRSIMRKYNKRKVHTVCIGHFHTYIQDQLFMVNGSQIGYDDYANALGMDYDIPKQTFFLVDKKRQCRTVTVPITYTI